MSTALSSVYRLTYEDWLASADDGVMREIIEGELHVVPPPTVEHQRISRRIMRVVDAFLERAASGEAIYAPVGLKLGEDNVLEPDILVVLNDGAASIEPSAVVGPADVVIEILSPGTAKRDVGVKKRIYEAAGVREYWIVDPVAKRIEVLALRDAVYVSDGLHEIDATLTSPVLPGLELSLRDVFSAAK